MAAITSGPPAVPGAAYTPFTRGARPSATTTFLKYPASSSHPPADSWARDRLRSRRSWGSRRPDRSMGPATSWGKKEMNSA